MEDKNKSIILDKISFSLIFVLGVILPVLFFPVAGISVDISKTVLVEVFGGLIILFWLLARLVGGDIKLPKTGIIFAGFLILLSLFVSAIVSPSHLKSFIGLGFEIGTVSFFVIAFLIFLISSTFFQSKERIIDFYLGILISSILVAVFQIARILFGTDFLSLSVLTNQLSNLIGKWNDMAIFFGLVSILSISTIEIFPVNNNLLKALLYFVLLASIFFMALINFPLVWAFVGVSALILAVFSLYGNKSSKVKDSSFPTTSAAIFVISLIFFFMSSTVGAYLSTTLGIVQVEARPSINSTIEVAKSTLENNLFFGSGPNRFTPEWLLYKPATINQSVFWNTDFDFGFGVILTSLVTSGLFGFLSWILFLVLYLYLGIRLFIKIPSNQVIRYLSMSSFLSGLYLWVFITLYVPSAGLYLLGFIFTGIFISTLVLAGILKNYSINILGKVRFGFISALILIFLLIGVVSLEYLFVEKFLSYVYFQKSLKSLNVDVNVEKAQEYMTKAIGLSEEDLYYRANAELGIVKLTNLSRVTGVPQDKMKADFQSILGITIDSAKKATEINGTDYSNFITLGKVYDSIVPLGISGAYESAKDAYNKALLLNPDSPEILLTLARLEVAHGNTKEAKIYIDRALSKKQNYVDAVFFLSQLEARDGNIKEAIARTEQAATIAPNEMVVFFQLGLLKYNNKDYTGAIAALERAIAINKDYSNAKYFLGLSYYKANRSTDAVKQFEEIEILNPDNQEVKNILINLNAGKDPFANAKAIIKPEKRTALPIKEN